MREPYASVVLFALWVGGIHSSFAFPITEEHQAAPPPCVEEEVDRNLPSASLVMRAFRAPSVTEEATLQEIHAIQSYWSQYGVRVDTPGRIDVLRRPVWFDGYAKDLAANLDEPPGRSGSGADSKTRVEALVFSNLKAFWQSHMPAKAGEIWLVVTPQLVAPGTLLAGMFRDLYGLGLTPHGNHMSNGQRPVAHPQMPHLLADDLRNNGAPPTLLLVPRAKHKDPFIGAHELGHILGLQHRPARTALMATSRLSGCRPVLSPKEQALALKNMQRYTKAKNQGEETAQP